MDLSYATVLINASYLAIHHETPTNIVCRGELRVPINFDRPPDQPTLTEHCVQKLEEHLSEGLRAIRIKIKFETDIMKVGLRWTPLLVVSHVHGLLIDNVYNFAVYAYFHFRIHSKFEALKVFSTIGKNICDSEIMLNFILTNNHWPGMLTKYHCGNICFKIV